MTDKPENPHFNGLTPAEAERLAMLAEEAAEVIQIIGKILRHGYENFHPDAPETTNRELLAMEVGDFTSIADKMVEVGDIPFGMVEKYFWDNSGSTWMYKLQHTHHQKDAMLEERAKS
ncbi:MAG: hypothetical protein COA96_10270 [SAR86 cluster bacterium]|uniref:Uncharacterized protein n=1 Tax=SAR86 cluster bacterium TaxID=2030880 RepID=A0A2A5AYE5_9GAMM|nr:MAG: hypothetical protein COA96_10270 [SAR86 cluster bacterium]